MEKIQLRFHIIAIAIAGLPFLLGGMVYLINPYYVGLLILPGSRIQPFGWLVCFILLIAAGFGYLGTTTVLARLSRRQNNSGKKLIPIGLVGIGVVLSVGTMVCLILLGPAMLWTLSTPTLAPISDAVATAAPTLAPTHDAVIAAAPQENKNLLPDRVFVQKNGVVITVDPRLELMSIVQYLCDDNHSYMRKEGTSYSQRVKEYFEKYKDHPLIDFMNERMLSRGFAYDAPVAAVLFLDSQLEPDNTISIPPEYLGRFGGQATFLAFSEELRQFALDTDYARFYRDNILFYRDAINSMAQTLQGDNLPQELQDYFGVEYRSFTIDPVFLYVDHAGFGATIGEGKETQVYCIMGNGASAGACRHEFSHSFVNRFTSDNIDLAMKYSDRFGPIKQSMVKQAYGTWEITLNEHIIRAVHIRLGSRDNPLMEKWLLAAELSRGFIYIESAVDSLKEYEKNREKYQKLSKFYPVLLENLHSFENR